MRSAECKVLNAQVQHQPVRSSAKVLGAFLELSSGTGPVHELHEGSTSNISRPRTDWSRSLSSFCRRSLFLREPSRQSSSCSTEQEPWNHQVLLGTFSDLLRECLDRGGPDAALRYHRRPQ